MKVGGSPLKLLEMAPISHIFFVDDCLLFLKGKASYVRVLNETLNLFCEASRLEVHLGKSKFFASTNISQAKGWKFSQICSIP